MTWKTTASLIAIAAVAGAGPAAAEGELHIFNWGNYTNPELITKFEKEFDVKVTVTDFDSNDTALAKVRAGGHGFDIVVPSGHVVPVWISEGLLLETRPDQMENFHNMAERWVDVPFDEGRHYTVPWQWGTTGVAVNTSVYDGDPNTSAIFMDPPDELKGKVNVVPEMSDVMHLAIRYMGGEQCTGDMEILKKVRDKMVEAKQHWQSMDYGTTEKLATGEWRQASTGTARPSGPGCRIPMSSTVIPRRAIRSGWTMSRCWPTPGIRRTPSSSRTSSWSRKTPL
jgi:spermidine/putrescine transport system substrate-binding protein